MIDTVDTLTSIMTDVATDLAAGINVENPNVPDFSVRAGLLASCIEEGSEAQKFLLGIDPSCECEGLSNHIEGVLSAMTMGIKTAQSIIESVAHWKQAMVSPEGVNPAHMIAYAGHIVSGVQFFDGGIAEALREKQEITVGLIGAWQGMIQAVMSDPDADETVVIDTLKATDALLDVVVLLSRDVLGIFGIKTVEVPA